MAEDNTQTAAAPETETAERQPQDVKIEDVGPGRKKLTIQVPASRVMAKLEEGYGRLRTEAALPGFRRGRAPRRLIEKRFSQSIRDDARASLLSESYTQAVEEHKLDVLGEPQIKDADKIELPDNADLTYEVEVEVTPDVALPELGSLAINKTKITVSDEDVEKEVQQLGRRNGKVVDATGAVQPDDYVQGDVKVLAGHDAGEGAQVINEQPGAFVHVPEKDAKGHIVGIVVDDLPKHLVGKNAGDEVRINLTGPTSHENEKIRDQAITVTLKITRVQRVEAASLETLVEQTGMETADKLKTRLREMLEERATRQQQSDMHEQACKQLLEKVDLTLPTGITGRQTARLLRRQAMELAYRGVPEQQVEQQIAEARGSSEEEAKRQLKLFFILDKAARDLNIEVSEGEINGRIAMLAMQQGRRPEKLRQQMQRNNEIEALYLSIREQKTLDQIVGKAQVTEVDKA
jgi:trigger factor